MSCLYILEIKPLLVTSFTNIFSHSVDCLFILLTVSLGTALSFPWFSLWPWLVSHVRALVSTQLKTRGPCSSVSAPPPTRSSRLGLLASQLRASARRRLGSLHLCWAWKLQAVSGGDRRAHLSRFLSVRDCCPSWPNGQCLKKTCFSILPGILIVSGEGSVRSLLLHGRTQKLFLSF